jgi:subtilase family serine protease
MSVSLYHLYRNIVTKGHFEETVPKDYAVSVCNLFAQLGVRGSTIFFSSGDSKQSVSSYRVKTN